MASKTIAYPQKIVDHYISNLKNTINVKGVLLFGSFAYGKPTKHSDVDLIVVSSALNQKSFDNCMDIIGYTPREFNNLEKHSAIGAVAKKKGRWIYRSKR
jgi:predicted nucleotidyltransferase